MLDLARYPLISSAYREHCDGLHYFSGNRKGPFLQEGEMLNHRSHTSADVDLRSIAKRAMLDRGFLIQVPDEAQSQLEIEREPAFETLKLPDLH